jgi:hypothetical protein
VGLQRVVMRNKCKTLVEIPEEKTKKEHNDNFNMETGCKDADHIKPNGSQLYKFDQQK